MSKGSGLVKTIRSEFAAIVVDQKQITDLTVELTNTRVAPLKPLVLEHFNSYVSEIINPELERCFLEPATSLEYLEGEFRITTGMFNVDGESYKDYTEIPRDALRKTMRFMDSYVEKFAWVHSIEYEFGLPK